MACCGFSDLREAKPLLGSDAIKVVQLKSNWSKQRLFEDCRFQKRSFDEMPLHRDVWVMDEKWAAEWQGAWTAVFQGEDVSPYEVGFITPISIDRIGDDAAEVEWFANTHDRFHAVPIFLPRRVFKYCVCAYEYEKRFTVFVDGQWLDKLHDRTHSTFAMVDACGFGKMLQADVVSANAIRKVRDGIDDLAAKTPKVAFTSFADSLLLKTNWKIGRWDNPTAVIYEPETFVSLLSEIDDLYRTELGVGTYATLAQGNNDLFGDELFHSSATGNHISLNSLGLPFAQIAAIEHQARSNIKSKIHKPNQLYIDRQLFWSMNFKDWKWKQAIPTYGYDQKLVAKDGEYIAISRDALTTKLDE